MPSSFARLPQSLRSLGRCVGLLAVATLALALVPPAARAMPPAPPASTITVTTEVAVNDPNDGKCSITEAFQAIYNGNGQPYNECSAATSPVLIQFAPAIAAKPIKLSNSLNINSGMDVAVVGPAILSGNSATTIFHVTNGTLSIASLILKDGNTGGGGAITEDGGQVNIAGVSFTGNVAASSNGGAILNSGGKLYIVGSNFSGNKATSGSGGAIWSSNLDGSVAIAGTNFAGNIAGSNGGALYITSSNGSGTDIMDVNFAGNIAASSSGSDPTAIGGGAIYNTSGSVLNLTRDVLSGNLAPYGSGGAIYNASATDANITITDSSFNANIAGLPSATTSLGGAIYNQGTISLDRVTVLANAVAGNGAAIANDRGAILNVTNTSFTANAASGDGGGLYNYNTQQTHGPPYPQATLLNATFSSNAAGGQGGGIFNGPSQGPLTLGNTIVDNSAGGNCQGSLVSLGHNLDSATTCNFNQAGDLSSADPKLDVPFFHGGPLPSLLTQKLKPGSAALDAGDAAICSAAPVNNEDQRGVARPKDGDGDGGAVCDIGAFEGDAIAAGYGSTPVQPGPISFGSSTVGGPALNANISVFETGNGPLTVNHPVLGGINPGDFAVDPNLSFTIPDDGPAQNVPLTCAPTALGLRTATLTLSTNDPSKPTVTYTLICTGVPTPVPGFGSTPAAPGPVDFGSIQLGSIANASISVFETGSATLTVNSPVLGGANPGDFGVNPNLSLTINDGDPTQTIPLACTPTALGIRTATLTLSTNDPSKPSVTYNLSCTATPVPPPILDTPGTSIGNTPSPGNFGPYGLAASPDGRNVYVADSGDNTLSSFTRDATSGQLTFQAQYVDGSTGGNDLKGSWIVLASPDGRNVYVASGSGSIINPGDNAITAFVRNPDTGALTLVDRVKEGDTYAFGAQFHGLQGVYGLAISPDGRFIYASSTTDSSIVVLDRNQTTGGVAFPFNGPVQVYSAPGNSDPDLNAAYGIALSPDGSNLYATGYAADTLVVFKRNAADGTLQKVEKHTNLQNGVDGLNGVFRVTVSPDGAYVYTASYDDNAVTVFRRDQSTGKLTFVTTYKNGVGTIDGIGNASAVTVSADGAHLFATGYGSNAVAVFNRDSATGLLSFAQVIKRNVNTGLPALKGARDVVISPDGATVYATGFLDNQVVTLPFANPTPVIELLRPSSARAGDPAFTLYVDGEGFMPTSQVRWNGSNRATTYVNNHLLKADISAADINVAGPYPVLVPVTVVNPAPGGGTSNIVNFTIVGPDENPVPSLERLSPSAAPAGGPAFTLFVAGASFLPSSTVQWNGADRPTTYVSANTLKAQISAADIAQPGVAGVTVVNPGPGGGTSNALPFTIVGPGANPIPSITRIDPPSTPAASATASALTLTVVGDGFLEGSQVQWDGEGRPTTYVSSTELRAIIPATDLTTAGTAGVTVRNPTPGGGDSNAATFTIAGFGDNPVPTARSLGFAPGSGGTWTLIVDGGGFIPGSKIQWNGQDRQTVFISDTQLNAIITTDDFSGAAVVTAVSPTPGGGSSNELLYNPQRLYLPVVVR
jgi:6-phosphogluconolactonase (cycloisomerase 2 family)